MNESESLFLLAARRHALTPRAGRAHEPRHLGPRFSHLRSTRGHTNWMYRQVPWSEGVGQCPYLKVLTGLQRRPKGWWPRYRHLLSTAKDSAHVRAEISIGFLINAS